MSLGMFCGIPLPFHIWDEKLTRIMIAAFPLVGAIIGGIWWGTGMLLMTINAPIVMSAAILTIMPFFVAGFIHLDGYMDTSDAYLSWRPLEDRIRILKDPLVGAFAVIMLCILFLLQFAAMHTIADGGRFLALIAAICVISRSCSALAIFTLKHMPESNYAAMLGKGAGTGYKIFIAIIGLGAIALSVIYAGLIGLLVALAVVVGYTLAMRVVYKVFKGVSGDLLGYALVIGELCGLIALALLQAINVYGWRC